MSRDGITAFALNDLNGNDCGEVRNTGVFELKPLGRIRQRPDDNGLMVDYFEPVDEVSKLFERLDRMIKKNKERWSKEDGDI